MSVLQYRLVMEHLLEMREQTIDHILILIIPILSQHLGNINKSILPEKRMENSGLKKNGRWPMGKLMSENDIKFELSIFVEPFPDKNYAIPHYNIERMGTFVVL